jgi:hypothetical protein
VSLPWVAEHGAPLELRSRATPRRHTCIRSPVATRSKQEAACHARRKHILCKHILCKHRLHPSRPLEHPTKLFTRFDWVVVENGWDLLT